MFQDEIFWNNSLVWSGFCQQNSNILTFKDVTDSWLQWLGLFLVQFLQQYIQSLVPTEIVNAVLSRNWLLVHNAHLLATVRGASPQASCAHLHIYVYILTIPSPSFWKPESAIARCFPPVAMGSICASPGPIASALGWLTSPRNSDVTQQAVRVCSKGSCLPIEILLRNRQSWISLEAIVWYSSSTTNMYIRTMYIHFCVDSFFKDFVTYWYVYTEVYIYSMQVRGHIHSYLYIAML